MPTSTTPFADGAPALWKSRLGWPIPSALPFEKFPPVTNVTGRHRPPSTEQMERWMESHADSNLLLRVRPDVIGLDVDAYDEKRGDTTLATLMDKHGPLPPAPRSSARPAPSGIYFYKLDVWMDWELMRDPGEHVEVIRHGHRYAVVAPSWHQGAGAAYEWHSSLVHYDELPMLPMEWYVHLTQGCECYRMERAARKTLLTKYRNRPAGARGEAEAMFDFRKQLDELTNTVEGSRNEQLSRIAGRTIFYDVALNGTLDVDVVTQHLYEAAILSGLEPTEAKRTIESALHYAERMAAE